MLLNRKMNATYMKEILVILFKSFDLSFHLSIRILDNQISCKHIVKAINQHFIIIH